MNRHALQVLQLRETLAHIAGRASSPLGAEAVRALEPSDAFVVVDEELRRVHQMVGFALRVDDWVIPAIPDVRAALRRLEVEGSVLEGAQLRDAGVLLRSARETARVIAGQADHFPLLGMIGERLHRDEAQEERLRLAIDEAGVVRDGASRELARLRREIRGARARIVEQLERFMASLPARYQVSDASVGVRDGRFVVPVRREARAEVGGLVHDESATGATIFVEPPLAIELMNRLRELEMAEAREVLRVLRELTDALRPSAPLLQDSLAALVDLDSLFARARYALEHDGRKPEITAAATHLRIVHGRHPLLLASGSPVVPFDLDLDADECTLLITGPNTGGKTVLLKAIGLTCLLAQSGVIPPVGDGTRLPLLRDVFADIGDEQSIEASLSTFSAHLVNLREILQHATHDTLVLIDEMGSGTDPAEGGALAQAILVELTRRGARTVATTHLGQLKLLAGTERGVVNASLQFDAVELRPTYRLQKGIPGRSYGIAIARRLGFPEDITASATSYMPQTERDVSQLLDELEQKERALTAALSEARGARLDAEALRRTLEERDEELRTRERDAERRARQQARDLLLGAREEVEAAIREVRAAASAENTEALDDAIRSARRRVEQRAQRQTERMPEPLPAAGGRRPKRLQVGGRVRVAATGAEGVLLELRDDRAVVEAGGLRLQLPARSLEPLDAAAAPARKPQRGFGWSAPDLEASSEVDLRGVRAEEVAGLLHPALDAAIQTALPSLRIIHGKGTGALREVVTELLRADARIKRFRPGGMGEGGTGVTVVELE